MKRNLMILGVAILFAACGTPATDTNKMKTELDKLKKERDGLNVKITKLEDEIAKNDSTKDDKIKTVESVTLASAVFNNYIDVQGKVDADENVSVTAEVGGTVSKINVKIGDEVHEGQVLAELDAKVYQQGLSELKNALDLANTMYDKQKNLWEQKIGTEMQFLQAKNQKESLEKKMSTMEQQIEMTKIKSPINGIVDAMDIKLGQATMPGLSAVRVVNLSTLKVKGEVAEGYASKVKDGNPVELIFPDTQDTLRTKITYAAKVISPLNRTFTVTVNLDSKKELHPNQVAVLKIIDYSNPKAIIIPVNTIQHAQDGDFVFVSENKKAKKVRVKIGKIYNGNAEVLDGLKDGDQLIVKGFQELNEGEEIKF